MKDDTKEYFQLAIEGLEKRLEARLIGLEKLMTQAGENAEKRLDAMDKIIEVVKTELGLLTAFRNQMDGKVSQGELNSTRLIAYAGLFISMASTVLRLLGY